MSWHVYLLATGAGWFLLEEGRGNSAWAWGRPAPTPPKHTARLLLGIYCVAEKLAVLIP